MDFSTIIGAIGQATEMPEGFDVKTGRGNTIRTNPDTLATSRVGVWGGGDAVSGPASVIGAIAAGRKAASSIDKYLGFSTSTTMIQSIEAAYYDLNHIEREVISN